MSIICSVHESVLPIFKNFLMKFQSAELMIHLIHPSLEVLMRSFFSYFLQPQVLCSSTSDDLINIDIKSNKVPAKSIFLGKACTLINNKRKEDKDFLEKLLRSYLDTAEYMQKKLPLKNKNIKAFSCIDPKKILNGDEDTTQGLTYLVDIMPTVLTDDERSAYLREVYSLLADPLLPSIIRKDGEGNDIEVSCLDWWISLEFRYPSCFKMATAVLSIFHGPRVEGSFSGMTDIIDSKSGRLDIESYDAMQTEIRIDG